MPEARADVHTSGPGRDPRIVVLGHLMRQFPVQLAVLALLSVTSAAVPIVFIVLTASVASALVEAPVGRAVAFGPGTLVVIGVCLVAMQSVVAIRQSVAEALGRRMDMDFRDRLAQIVSRPAAVAHLEGATRLPDVDVALGVMNRLGGPAGGLLGLVGQVHRVLVCLAGVVLVARASPVGGIVIAVASAPVALVLRRDAQVDTLGDNLDDHRLRRVHYLRDLVLRPGGEKEVHLFGLGSWLADRHQVAWESAAELAWSGRVWRHRSLLATMLLVAAFTVGAWTAVGAHRDGVASFTELVTALQALIVMFPLVLVSDDDRLATIGWSSVAALQRLDARVGDATTASAVRGDAGPPSRNEGVRFTDVDFAYPGSPSVLSHFTLDIPAGRTTAIVGPNGAGKSTILALLSQFYQPTSGTVTIGGSAVDDRRRGEVSVVLQQPMRLPLSARDNITWGWPGPADQAVLEDVVDATGLRAVIERLPSGWDTLLSDDVPGAVDLSGGEWQRVGVARGLYALRCGASVLALDEPTSAMDADGERQVFENIMTASEGCTTILVSHRFATVRNVDHIVVLDRGTVLEQGTHDELMSKGALYARMFRAQSELHA